MALGPNYKLPNNYMAFCPSYKIPKIKIKTGLSSTYPKDLNSEARLWNGKVLGTHFGQTESGLLNSCVLCTPFMHAMNDMLHMQNKNKSHKFIYECILFLILKQFRSIFVSKTN